MLHKCLQDLTAKEEDQPQVKTEAWEADFDNDMLEDGPAQEKEVLTTKLGRKNLLQHKGSKGDGEETTDADIAASTPLLPTSGKRKPHAQHRRPPPRDLRRRHRRRTRLGVQGGRSHLRGQRRRRRMLPRHCRNWRRHQSQRQLHLLQLSAPKSHNRNR